MRNRCLQVGLAVAACLLVLGMPLSPAAAPLIIVDPAHGGSDPGVTVTEKFKEKDVTLALGRLLKKELEKEDTFRVLLTRAGDAEISVEDRRKTLESSRPALVVSLHVNAGFGRSAKGYEVYFQGFQKGPGGGKGGSAAIIGDMTKTKHLNESVRVAQGIQRGLESVFPKEGRGLREAALPLLEGTTFAGVIVEIGFASSPENRKKLTEETSQQAIARAIARGIREGMGRP